MSSKKYSAVIFGATGFTGQYVLKEFIKKGLNATVNRIAIAGRNETALRNVLNKMAESKADVISQVGIIVADCSNQKSLENMAAQADVVLNCVGPYRLYGEPVIQACITSGAHYLDISGEPQFMETVQLKYNEEAKKKHLFIISACAFDCIPAEIGALYTSSLYRDKQDKLLPGVQCSSIESFLTLKTGDKGFAGHYATYESAVRGFGDQGSLFKVRKEYSKLREQQDKESQTKKAKIPTPGRTLRKKTSPFFDNRLNKWCLPFPGADPSVVRRSQLSLAENLESDGGYRGEAAAAQYTAYFTLPSFYYLVLFLIFGTIFQFLANRSWGRSLLLKHPKFFTHGLFSHEGPTEDQMKTTSFEMTLFAEGYKEAPKSQSDKTDKKIVVKISGPEPGYVATPLFFLQCYYVLKEEIISEKPLTRCKGGVVTPGYAFAGTTLVERLRANGISFNVAQ